LNGLFLYNKKEKNKEFFMSLFNLPPNPTPESVLLAREFLEEANRNFIQERDSAYDVVRRFWYRNVDRNGTLSIDGDQSSGLEILQALGVNARAVMMVAYARVEMLLMISYMLGKQDLIDLTQLLPPYEIEYNEDGSFKSATLIVPPVTNDDVDGEGEGEGEGE
jgi:hypothetical protein